VIAQERRHLGRGHLEHGRAQAPLQVPLRDLGQRDVVRAVLGALDEPGAGEAVAVAVDPELVAAVRDAFSAARIRLAAMTPFLAEAFNSARPYLPAGAAWLAVGEPGRICVACLDGARWVALRSQRSQGELAASLPLALEQCRLAEGIEEDAAEVCVVTREALPAGLAPAGRWRFRTIPAPAPAQRRATA
jgi:hypothetical protein